MVGSAIIRKLLSSDYTNIICNYHKRPSNFNLNHNLCNFVPLNLICQSDVEIFFDQERPDYVFLAAAKVGGILANSIYKAEFMYDNLAIALNVINAAYKCKVKKLLNLGSSCIYPKLAPQPLKEEYLLTGALEPTNEPYAIAKIAAIKLCRYYNEQYGTNFISVMPTNLYGPNDNFDLKTAHVLPALIRKFHLAKLLKIGKYEEIEKDIQKRPLSHNLDHDLKHALEQIGITTDNVELWGSGEPFREFLYVDDLAEACIFLMQSFDSKDLDHDFLNIGTGMDIRIKDLAVHIKDITGFTGDIKYDILRPDGTPRKLLDISRITSLGWKANTSLLEGIRKTYEFYRNYREHDKI